MPRRIRIAAALCVGAVTAACAGSAQAADFVVPFDNWQVGGTLTLAKLHQNISFPSGSTFNGSADLTTDQLTGNVSIPTFTSTIRVLGIPTQVTQQIVPAGPATGTITLGSGGTVTIAGTSADTIYLRSLGIGPISIPTTCHTASPVVFALNYTGPLNLSAGFTFSGRTTIPQLAGCGLVGPLLSSLLSGPNNAYSLSLSPPA